MDAFNWTVKKIAENFTRNEPLHWKANKSILECLNSILRILKENRAKMTDIHEEN